MSSKTSDWQIFHNNHLSVVYGTYRNQDGTTLHAPWKLAACLEPSDICLLKRLRPGACPCEHNAFALRTQNDPEVLEIYENDRKKQLLKCGSVSPDNPDTFTISAVVKENGPAVYGLPFLLKDLLPMVARNNHVILTGAR